MRALLLLLLWTAAASGQWFGGGGSKTLRVTWVLCNEESCTSGQDKTNHVIVTDAAKVRRCYLEAKTAPTGAALKVQVNKNGASLHPGVEIKLDPGQHGPIRATFPAASLAENDLLTVDIVQVGSTIAGQDVTLVCRLE